MAERTRPKQSLTFQSRCVKGDLAGSIEHEAWVVSYRSSVDTNSVSCGIFFRDIAPQSSAQLVGGCINYIFLHYMCNTVNRICLRAERIRVTGGVLGAVVPSAAV